MIDVLTPGCDPEPPRSQRIFGSVTTGVGVWRAVAAEAASPRAARGDVDEHE